jgi:hypothetical protein
MKYFIPFSIVIFSCLSTFAISKELKRDMFYTSHFQLDTSDLNQLHSFLNPDMIRNVMIYKPFSNEIKKEKWKFSTDIKILANGNSYYELIKTNDYESENYNASGKYYREDNNKLIYYNPYTMSDQIIYDMNLELNDTFNITFPNDSYQMIVVKVDSVQFLDKKVRKRLNLKCKPKGLDIPDRNINWIEGLGAMEYVFSEFGLCGSGDVSYAVVRCILENNLEIYRKPGVLDCWTSSIDRTNSDLDSTATWYSSSYKSNFSDGDCRLQLDITKVVRDTFLLGKKANIIGVRSSSIYYPESEIIVFQNMGKVYFFEDNKWNLLYDYVAKVGDTIAYNVSKKYNYYSRFSIPIPFDSEIPSRNPYSLVVVKIDSVKSQNGIFLKRFITKSLDKFQIQKMDTIIENVGSNYKLFGNNVIILPPDCKVISPSLHCYSDENIFIKFIEGECDNINSQQNILIAEIRLFPNPGEDILHISASKNVIYPIDIQLLDSNGNVIIETTQVDNKIGLSTYKLIPSIYLVRLKDANGRFWYGKWIKI